MTESKLNPFDAELLVMIGDIAKSQPEVEEKPDRYEITVDTTEIQGNAIQQPPWNATLFSLLKWEVRNRHKQLGNQPRKQSRGFAVYM